MLATEHLYLQTDRHMDAICDEAIYNVLIMSLLLDCVGKDIMLSGCLSLHHVYSFVRSDIVTTISYYKWLEQSR